MVEILNVCIVNYIIWFSRRFLHYWLFKISDYPFLSISKSPDSAVPHSFTWTFTSIFVCWDKNRAKNVVNIRLTFMKWIQTWLQMNADVAPCVLDVQVGNCLLTSSPYQLRTLLTIIWMLCSQVVSAAPCRQVLQSFKKTSKIACPKYSADPKQQRGAL